MNLLHSDVCESPLAGHNRSRGKTLPSHPWVQSEGDQQPERAASVPLKQLELGSKEQGHSSIPGSSWGFHPYGKAASPPLGSSTRGVKALHHPTGVGRCP